MNKLQAKVAARNKVNALALEIAPKILTALAPFVGQPLRTKEGSRTAKFAKMVEALDLPCTPGCQVTIRAESYWFRAHVYCSVTTENGVSMQQETTICLGDLDGRTLTSVAALPTVACYPTNFTVESILTARAAVRAARAALQSAEHALCGFGEHDNH